MKPLNRQTAQLPNQRPVKVLQFGEGNFLRGYVDWMIDVLNEKTAFNGAVAVVQPRDRSRRTIEALRQQDGLFHVLLNGIRQGEPTQEKRLISCIASAQNPYDGYAAYLALGENPDLEFIFSNTTEAGIAFDAGDTSIDSIPASFPGKLTALLYHRFRHFGGDPAKGLTIIPTELIENNGTALRQIVLQYAKNWQLPQGFADWVQAHLAFCNTLVDRIVPGFPKDTIDAVQQELGYADNLVVTAEPYHLLVIEAPDAVRQAFPAQEAGLQVKFVDDLTPYRTSKVRILNGAHTTLVPVAYLHGLRTVQEAVEDEQTGRFIREAIYSEIVPTLDMPDDELKQFADDVIERFRNPFIRHELLSISLNSISKYKVRVLPSVLAYAARKGRLPEHLLQALAALILFYKGTWRGKRIPLNDAPEVLAFFEQAWQQGDAEAVVTATLANTALWDTDLTQVAGMAEAVTAHLRQLQQTEATISAK
ncbi:tagaturonate reductase [Pontibacter sp. E15-1]|uniref:tagaturonate reductase n=1 Tax=Pontibacter sp. E15-1 TaxID=2919918 RepID=UPI001F4FAC10|nr:tagaturonate reductase [Pontibacter sp. E15-1]MCJ8167019.1 tagaturonate reductase [Pontibacter sp. E15-1]